MSLTIALAVLAAAIAHAAWNAMLRVRGDRFLIAAAIAGVTTLLALPLAFFFPVPEPAAWPFIAATVPIHTAYYLTLVKAYEHGDLSQVYPLARGAAPLLTLFVSAAAFGEPVGPAAAAGIVVLSLGIALLAFERGWSGLRAKPMGALMALATALCIAGYTIADGHGARASGNAHGFTLWLFMLNGMPFLAWALATRGRAVLDTARQAWLPVLGAAILSMGAYWVVLWAMTEAPIPQVAALRETSVVFAVLIGIVLLKERLTAIRIASPLIVLAGLALMRLA